jgi:hypothetical protein
VTFLTIIDVIIPTASIQKFILLNTNNVIQIYFIIFQLRGPNNSVPMRTRFAPSSIAIL